MQNNGERVKRNFVQIYKIQKRKKEKYLLKNEEKKERARNILTINRINGKKKFLINSNHHKL